MKYNLAINYAHVILCFVVYLCSNRSNIKFISGLNICAIGSAYLRSRTGKVILLGGRDTVPGS